MSNERTLQSEDNYIDIINIEDLTLPLNDNDSIEEYTKDAFDKLLDKEEYDLNF